jgi:hypothetical protein
VLLNGERITPTHNNNYSNANYKPLNQLIDKLKKEPTLTSSVNDQWAKADMMAMQQALWAPFVNREFTDFFASRIDTGCYVQHVLYEFDWTLICAK